MGTLDQYLGMLPPELRKGLEAETKVDDAELAAELAELAAEVAALSIDVSNHASLRQLIHFIDNGPAEQFSSLCYREITGGPFPSSVIWWTSSAKVAKIVEKNIVYSGAFPTSFEWKMYESDGVTVLTSVTDNIVYNGAFEVNRTRTIS